MGMTALETRLGALAADFARAVMQLVMAAPVAEIVDLKGTPRPATKLPATKLSVTKLSAAKPPAARASSAPRSVEAAARSVETRRIRELMDPSITTIEGLLRARGPHRLEELQRVLQLEAETLASALKVALETERLELRTKGGESRYRLGPKSSKSIHTKPARRSRAGKPK